MDRAQVVADGSAVYIATQRAGSKAVKYVQDEIIRYDLIDSGRLFRSIDYRIHRTPSGNIIADVGPFKDKYVLSYAKFPHDGTDSPITAGGKIMPVKIKRGGPLLFLKSVSGQAAKPYLANGLKKIRAEDWYR